MKRKKTTKKNFDSIFIFIIVTANLTSDQYLPIPEETYVQGKSKERQFKKNQIHHT